MDTPITMLAGYQGTSLWPSWPIRIATWSTYSHLAIVDSSRGADRYVCESWPSNGVEWVSSLSQNHKDKTRVDLYEFVEPITQVQREVMLAFLDAQAGKPYDWSGVFRFAIHGLPNIKGAWFCSELGMAASIKLGHPLLNEKPEKVSPAMAFRSPVIRPYGYCYTSRKGDGKIIRI